MTLKDLVMSFDFDRLRPYLEKDVNGEEYVLYAFRQAYDALRRGEPNPDYKGSVRIERNPFLTCGNVSFWKMVLGSVRPRKSLPLN